MDITTEAWVLPAGTADRTPGHLSLEEITIPAPADHEAVVEPIFGCWEANMAHGVARNPIDVCRARGEDQIVLGNSGVVRVLSPARSGPCPPAGTLCMVMPFGTTDERGYVKYVSGYDQPGSYGILARRTKTPARLLLPLPENTRHPVERWAACGRYLTAWDNWRIALACWRSQVEADDVGLVFGWGGGVALGQLDLARRAGFDTAMTSSKPKRLDQIAAAGHTAVDRTQFPDLEYDPERARQDAEYRARHKASEEKFLQVIVELSGGHGVAVFLDHLGGQLHRATLKALAREGVLATLGWKNGMRLWNLRATECITRHIHVHTHVFRQRDQFDIRDFMEREAWLPVTDGPVYDFTQVGELAEDYEANRVDSYVPLYRVNPL